MDEDPNVRHRNVGTLPVSESTGNLNQSAVSSDEDDDPVQYERHVEKRLSKLKSVLPQASDKLGYYADTALKALPERWRNWVVRGIFTIVMIFSFHFVVSKGATWLMITVFMIQLICFNEIIRIGLAVYRLYDLPWFRVLSWYFLITSDYFFFGESLIDYWGIVLQKDEFLHGLVDYHRFISFTLYIIGFIWFVLSLQKGFYLRQFSLFAWTHVTLLLIVTQSFLIVQNLLQGLIWFLCPVSMIICCDIMSYMFGFFFGKTPLIKLSPKKTWEGFIGGAFSTIIFGLLLATFLMEFPYFVCPIEDYNEELSNCTVPPSFQYRDFQAPKSIAAVMTFFRLSPVFHFRPFIFHTIVMALFASIIGPFGGFFASGLKRALKIKDFGDIIPGHGGLMDRFDCQLLMGSFVNAYIASFIKAHDPNKIMKQISWLAPTDQIFIYESLHDRLLRDGLIPN